MDQVTRLAAQNMHCTTPVIYISCDIGVAPQMCQGSPSNSSDDYFIFKH